MAVNYSELQYLKVLQEIIIENAKEEYSDIVERFRAGLITARTAYYQILKRSNGNLKNALPEASKERTGTGAYKIFGETMRFNLQNGFPLLTTKRVPFKTVLRELLWFINGDTQLRTLALQGVHIWDEWPYERYKTTAEYTAHPISKEEFIEKIKADEKFAKKYGDLGPVYGAQWRDFGGHDHFKMAIEKNLEDPVFCEKFAQLCDEYTLPWDWEKGAKGVDQLTNAIETLKNKPYDRRILVFAYNPQEVQDQALPACHAFFQFDVKDGELSCLMYQRSCDMFLGVPFNIASYAILTHMVAQVTGLKAREFIHVLGNAHIYKDHIEQVQEQLSRKPYIMPTLDLDPNVTTIDGFDDKKVKVLEYKCHEKIVGEVSV